MARLSARSVDAERELRADRILNAARELLVSWGYRRITIDEVARRAGVGKGTVYLHFSTKEQLFMTVMTASHLRMVELFLRDLDEDPAALLLSRMARSAYTRVQEDPVVRAIFIGDTDTLGSLIQVVSTALGDLAEERERAMDGYFELLREHGVLRADSSVQDQRHAFVAILIGFLTMEPAAEEHSGGHARPGRAPGLRGLRRPRAAEHAGAAHPRCPPAHGRPPARRDPQPHEHLTTTEGVTMDTVNFMDEELIRDPFTAFSRIRERGPLARCAIPGVEQPVWLVTRYDDVKMVLNDPRFVNDPANVPGAGADNMAAQMLQARGVPPEYNKYLLEGILAFDGADHLRLRRLVSRTFTARRVLELRPRMEEITEKLLDRLPEAAENGVVDLLEHFAYPLPIIVICELVGVPEEDHQLWREWSRTLVSSFGPSFAEAVRDMVAYIQELIGRRRAEPTGDLVSGLIQAQDEDGDRLSVSDGPWLRLLRPVA